MTKRSLVSNNLFVDQIPSIQNISYPSSGTMLGSFFHTCVDEFLSDINLSNSPIFSEAESTWSKSHPRINAFYDRNGDQENLVIDFIIPYFKEEDIEVYIDEKQRLIEVSGKRPDLDSNINDGDYIARTVARSSFKKTLRITGDKNYDFDNIKATHENGVLRLSLPKVKTEAQKKRIKLNA